MAEEAIFGKTATEVLTILYGHSPDGVWWTVRPGQPSLSPVSCKSAAAMFSSTTTVTTSSTGALALEAAVPFSAAWLSSLAAVWSDRSATHVIDLSSSPKEHDGCRPTAR